jgi:hypothetical protein
MKQQMEVAQANEHSKSRPVFIFEDISSGEK